MGNFRLKKQTKKIDKKLLILVISLTLLGLVFVADASAPEALNVFKDKYYFVKQQAIWASLGLFLLFLSSFINVNFWKKIALPLFIVSILFLIAVLIPEFSLKVMGARRWLVLGPIRFQPSELIKFSLVLYLAKVADSKKGLWSYFIPLGAVIFLIILEPDMGTAIVVSIIGMSQIFMSEIKIFHYLGTVILGLFSGLLLILSSDYRRDRLLTFLQKSQDPLGRDYHIRQILLALGSGGLFGVGLGQSRQKYLFLPEASTDSIFAIIAEEIGFIGGAIIIALMVWFIFRAFKIAKNAPNTFSQVAAVGFTCWIAGQAFLNIASMVALVPLTGIPLPFFSYGGSALTMLLLATGIILNISKYANEK